MMILIAITSGRVSDKITLSGILMEPNFTEPTKNIFVWNEYSE